MNFKLKAHIKILIGAIIFFWLLYLVIPLPNPLFKNDYSTVVLDKDDRILRLFLNDEQQWCLPPDESAVIPEKLKQAVLFFEDRYFDYHPGINPASTFRAFIQNFKAGQIISGASTITMQVARLMKPKDRTLSNKIMEMLQALKIEWKYSKNEILNIYLNHAPYGGNVIGYQAASLRYFRKFPRELTWAESATLAVLPNAPGLISPQQDHRRLQQKRDHVLLRLRDAGIIDSETYALSVLEDIPQNSHSITMRTPHLSRRLKSAFPDQAIFHTTIESELQETIRTILKIQQQHLQLLGINNLTALVVENANGAVRAYLGSTDFSRVQVDGIASARSSGSILKPFLYALSMDEGLILPQTSIKDIPTFFGPFSPANADQKYRGIVTAKEALIQSLNVPATRLLNKYGLEVFYYFLNEAGLSSLFRKAVDYGLPLIIGGAEVTPWDMATLYRGLALGGAFKPIHVLNPDQSDKKLKSAQKGNAVLNPDLTTVFKKKLISPGAAYLTLEMLNEVRRPGAEYYWQQYGNQRPLAWKTGTSYGQRDAWAIGVNPDWTIVVWAGNFTGEGNANLSGAESVGPVLFEIFNSLPVLSEKTWFERPDSALTKIDICARSGFAAGPYCQDKIQVDRPMNSKVMELCPYHKQLIISADEKEQVCSLCWEAGHKQVTRLIYPPEVEQYLRQSGSLENNIPAHRRSCPAPPTQNPLTITYPLQNAAIFIPRDFGGAQQKLSVRAAHQYQNQTLYWYLDTQYLGSSRRRHEKAIYLSRGRHTLEVVDQDGHKDAVSFYVTKGK